MTRSLLTHSFLLREQSESRGRGFSFQARIPSQTLFFSSILFLDFSAPIYCAIRSPLSKWRVVFSGFPWRERERARGRRRRRRRKKAPHISFLPSHCTPRARSQTTPRFRDLASRGARESIESIAALGTAAHSLQARRRRTIEAALEASSSPFRTRVTEPFQMST